MATILERAEWICPWSQQVLSDSAAAHLALNPGSFWPLRGGEWPGWSSFFWITKGADFCNSWGLDRKYLFVWLWKSFPLLLPQAGGFPWRLQTQSTIPQGAEPTSRPQKRKIQPGGTHWAKAHQTPDPKLITILLPLACFIWGWGGSRGG